MKRVEFGSKVYATNSNGEGLFTRQATEGAYTQIKGNSQFKANKTAKGFISQLKRAGLISSDAEATYINW
ncbi:hypothetical protein [Deinococcus misasensis]|uniref:hypothetical protein n=1 Tax=Deinococcus misasensis TaxID=392413 RepID=UPI0005576374|nr:hypothetical protein [Deinococcus misasensis]